MHEPLSLTPIGAGGVPLLRQAWARFGPAPEDLPAFLERESIDLNNSYFAWSHEVSPSTPRGFGLLGVRSGDDGSRCSLRTLAAPPASGPDGPDPKHLLVQAAIQAARALGAGAITAETRLTDDDTPALPDAALLHRVGFEQQGLLLSFAAGAERILQETVYLQVGLHEVDPSEILPWIEAFSPTRPPWQAQAESIARLRFPDLTYFMVASGTAAGYLAITDPHLEEVSLLQIGVLPDVRRQQVAVGALQELLTTHDRVRRVLVPPLVREGDPDLPPFLRAVGFEPTPLRRAEMVLALRP
ncbi:MAG: hypothetical protein ACM3ZA_02035 [Bacillota bacterium]